MIGSYKNKGELTGLAKAAELAESLTVRLAALDEQLKRVAALEDQAQALVVKLAQMERQALVAPSPDDGDDLQTLQGLITEEIDAALGDLGDVLAEDGAGALGSEIQPPSTITRLAAAAAAAVYIAFERGYRLDAEVR